MSEHFVRRSLARASSVVLGALAAASLALVSPVPAVTGVAVGLAIAALSATQASRWYVAPAFTTFIALTLLLQEPDAQPLLRFGERLAQTAVGVGVALVFGVLIPTLIRHYRKGDHHVSR
ncbi:FUSC family protein [Microbacterium aurum]